MKNKFNLPVRCGDPGLLRERDDRVQEQGVGEREQVRAEFDHHRAQQLPPEQAPQAGDDRRRRRRPFSIFLLVLLFVFVLVISKQSSVFRRIFRLKNVKK
jgi:hypothetical protein